LAVVFVVWTGYVEQNRKFSSTMDGVGMGILQSRILAGAALIAKMTALGVSVRRTLPTTRWSAQTRPAVQ